MPQDLPTRHVFLSGSHFVSFIPLVLLHVVSDPEVETLYHAVHVPLLSLTCGHPARAVFGTLRRKSSNASIHQK